MDQSKYIHHVFLSYLGAIENAPSKGTVSRNFLIYYFVLINKSVLIVKHSDSFQIFFVNHLCVKIILNDYVTFSIQV
jgi:hypothetical protein